MQQFINVKIGDQVKLNKTMFTCMKTTESFQCGLCGFKTQTERCPQGKSRPACFSSERTDRKSVYFLKSKIETQ